MYVSEAVFGVMIWVSHRSYMFIYNESLVFVNHSQHISANNYFNNSLYSLWALVKRSHSWGMQCQHVMTYCLSPKEHVDCFFNELILINTDAVCCLQVIDKYGQFIENSYSRNILVDFWRDLLWCKQEQWNKILIKLAVVNGR